jgi:hypothetical protein
VDDLDKIRERNEELERVNQALQKENAKLKVLMLEPTTLAVAGIVEAPSSPNRVRELAHLRNLRGNPGEPVGYGHPEAEAILRSENTEGDDVDTQRLKMVTRQLFSLGIHVKALERTVKEDKLELDRLLRHAKALQTKLEATEARNRRLETLLSDRESKTTNGE